MFRKLTDRFYASPQIGTDEIAEAAELGVKMIINNRPEGEADDQTPGDAIEARAIEAGIKYLAIPVSHAGFSQGQLDAMHQALEQADGPVLAYCRSGTRSTLLWAMAEAKRGANPQKIASLAAAAGYDISPVRPIVDMLAANSEA